MKIKQSQLEMIQDQMEMNHKQIGMNQKQIKSIQSQLKERRGRPKGVILTERDIKILQFIFEHKVVSRDQINIYFFDGASKSTVNGRLKKIFELGLIQRMLIEQGKRVIYTYSLTPNGFNKVKPLIAYGTQGKVTKSYAPLHDMILVDIRKAFEFKDSVKNYCTENILQSCPKIADEYQGFVNLKSDGVVCVETKVGILNLAVEFDSCVKSKKRYHKKIDAYYWESKVHGVLYICATSYVLNALHKVEREVSQKHQCSSKIYFALLNEITMDKKELIFRDIENYIFRVR